MKNILIICALLFACFNFAQYEVLHINSAFMGVNNRKSSDYNNVNLIIINELNFIFLVIFQYVKRY
jgi:hypothetical protein